MRRLIDWGRFALISWALVVLPVAGCASAPMTPEQEAAQAETLRELEETENSLVVLAQQLEQMEPGTPGHLAVSTQIVEAVERGAALEDELAEQDAEASQTFVGGIFDLFGPFIPGSGAFEPAVLSLAPLAFERPRKHFLNALKQVNPMNGQMAPGEAAASLLKAAGLIHSSEGSARVAAKDMAHPKGVRESKPVEA